MDNLISRVKGKLEVIRLENRYTKRNHRAAYKGNAEYRDGEYVRREGTKRVDAVVREVSAGRTGEKRR
ncbi:hypothetical protein MMC21_007355 [Puttea exsequens]|nr:hypothetical protein [Puttea exsequens]